MEQKGKIANIVVAGKLPGDRSWLWCDYKGLVGFRFIIEKIKRLK